MRNRPSEYSVATVRRLIHLNKRTNPVNDNFWQSLRYLLIGIGMFVAGKSQGNISASDVMHFADVAILAGSTGSSALVAAWGLYVKFRTRAVPEKTAARLDVPTTSPVTGAIEK